MSLAVKRIVFYIKHQSAKLEIMPTLCKIQYLAVFTKKVAIKIFKFC